MSSTLTIRTVELSDLPAVADLWCLLRREHAPFHPCYAVGPRERRLYLEALERAVADAGTVLRVVVEASGTIVGFCHGSLETGAPGVGSGSERLARIESIFVDSSVRDAGIGSALVTAVVEALRSAGATRFEATIHAENDGAIRFFERARFSLHTVTLSRES